MGKSDDDLADLLDPPEGLAPGKAEELLSQMAGDSIDRMMSGEFDPIVNPVEELTNQLDTFFEQLQHRRQMKSVAPQALATDVAASPDAIRMCATLPLEQQFEPAEAAFERETSAATGAQPFDHDLRSNGSETTGPARAMLVGFDEVADPPIYLKPLCWFAAPIEAMSSTARLAISLAAVASFLAACGTLSWVMILRQGQ